MFQEGHILNLQAGSSASPLQVRIHKLQTPFTLSAGMIVQVLRTPANVSAPKIAFLKLFDRRFAEEYRRRWGMGTWTAKYERELLEFSRSGNARLFLDKCRADPEFNDNNDNWSAAENEASLADEMRVIFMRESRAYTELKQHQGRLIPQLYSTVTLYIGDDNAGDGNVAKGSHVGNRSNVGNDSNAVGGNLGLSPEVFSVPGILIEYINGFRMSDLPEHTERSDWNYLVNRAVEATGDILTKSNVLNQDVRPDNMMVCRDSKAERGYRLVMIDFGHCRFREPRETDEEWGLAKHQQDEEGCMGEVMKIKLRQIGFESDCKRRMTWIDYAESG